MAADEDQRWGYLPSLDERRLAMAAHLLFFGAPVVAPLILYFTHRHRSRFVTYHALQAALFQALVGGVLGAATACVFTLLAAIMSGLWAAKAGDGAWRGFPLMEAVGR